MFGSMFHDHPSQFDAVLQHLFFHVQITAAESLSRDQIVFSSQQHSVNNNNPTVKERLDIKLINVPPTKEIVSESIRDLSAKHLNKLIIIFGTVVRTGNVNSRELKKKFACKACEKEYICESDLAEYNKFIMPLACEGMVEKKANPFFDVAKKIYNKNKGGNNQNNGGA